MYSLLHEGHSLELEEFKQFEIPRERSSRSHSQPFTRFAESSQMSKKCSHDSLTLYWTGLVRTMIISIVPAVVGIVYMPVRLHFSLHEKYSLELIQTV